MTLKQQMQTDASSVFLNRDEFAEMIQYKPYGGTTRNIKAIVSRNAREQRGQDVGRTLERNVEVWVANDDSNGIGKVTPGYDHVWIASDVPGRTDAMLVKSILGKDSGMWHLEVE